MKQKKSRKGYKRKGFRTPTGKNRQRYERRKPSKAHCARCGRVLSGVPRGTPSRLRKLTRSQRTVTREFGGVLCGRCVVSLETYRTRMEGGFMARRDLTIEKFLPKGWYQEVLKKAAKPAAESEEKPAEKKTKPKKPAEKKTKPKKPMEGKKKKPKKAVKSEKTKKKK